MNSFWFKVGTTSCRRHRLPKMRSIKKERQYCSTQQSKRGTNVQRSCTPQNFMEPASILSSTVKTKHSIIRKLDNLIISKYFSPSNVYFGRVWRPKLAVNRRSDRNSRSKDSAVSDIPTHAC